MNYIPTPPPAYWDNIPWWGFFGFALMAILVLAVLAPYTVGVARGSPSTKLTREQMMLSRENAERTRWDDERAEMRAECDATRHKLIGMAAVAHSLWHDLNNTVTAYNRMLGLMQRCARGEASAEVLRDRLVDLAPMDAPPELPAVDDVEPRRPGETKYA